MAGLIIYQGDSRELKITITDENGTTIDPSTFVDVKAYIYQNDTTQTEIGRWSLIGESGFNDMWVVSNKVRFILNSEMTGAAEVGILIIQVSCEYVDDESAFETLRVSKKGILGLVKLAKV